MLMNAQQVPIREMLIHNARIQRVHITVIVTKVSMEMDERVQVNNYYRIIKHYLYLLSITYDFPL